MCAEEAPLSPTLPPRSPGAPCPGAAIETCHPSRNFQLFGTVTGRDQINEQCVLNSKYQQQRRRQICLREKWRWEIMELESGVGEDRAERDGSGPGLGDPDTGLLRGFR